MNRFTFSIFFLAAAFAGGFQNAHGQAINATMQTASPRVVPSHGATSTTVRSVVNGRTGPQVVHGPAGTMHQRFNSNLPRTFAQIPANLQRNYPAPLQASNPAFTAVNVQKNGIGQQSLPIDSAAHQTELRTLAAMRQRRGIVTREGNILDPVTRQNEIRTLAAMRESRAIASAQQATVQDASMRESELRTLERMRERSTPDNQTLGTIDPHRRAIGRDPDGGPQRDNAEGPKANHEQKRHKKDHGTFNEAFGRHWHEWHDRDWWHEHCQTIVFVNAGYYFLDGSYWYPAYGYDPQQTYYDYDGPVYTYSNLLPDEVIANVQTALQDAGYYYGPITGSLSVDTRAAIANFQRDYGLTITGAIDEPTVEALGLEQNNGNYQTDQGY